MEVKSPLHSSPVPSSTVDAFLTSSQSYDVINLMAEPLSGCDGSYEVSWNEKAAGSCTPPTGGITYHNNTTLLDSGLQTTFIACPAPQDGGDAPGFYDVIATTKPPSRCLDNGCSDVTSSMATTARQLAELSTAVDSVYADDVTRQQFPVPVDVKIERGHDEMTSSMMLLAEHVLPSSEEVETYFSTVFIDAGGSYSTQTTGHHHPHHVYSQYHHPKAAQTELQHNLSPLSSSLLYNNDYNPVSEVQLGVSETSPSSQNLISYEENSNSCITEEARLLTSSLTSLAGLLPVFMTTAPDTSSSSMLCYHSSTCTTPSHRHAGTVRIDHWIIPLHIRVPKKQATFIFWIAPWNTGRF